MVNAFQWMGFLIGLAVVIGSIMATSASNPILFIDSPPDGESFDYNTITVSGRARGTDYAVLESVMVKDVLATGTILWHANISLNDGSNLITVVAMDNMRQSRTENITVYYNAPPPTPTPTPTPTSTLEQTSTPPVTLTSTLPPTNNPPAAFVDSIKPNPARQEQSVTFTCHGDDPDSGDCITEYRWESSIDGFLSNQKLFSISSLSSGSHQIILRVKDSHGQWSSEITRNLRVEAIEIPPTEIDDTTPEPSITPTPTPTPTPTLTPTPPPETGEISIHTNIENASFTISGPVPFSGSGILCRKGDVPAGTYTIIYQDVSGYNTPISETKTLSAGGLITFTGVYEPVWPLSIKVLLVIGVILSLIGIVLRLLTPTPTPTPIATPTLPSTPKPTLTHTPLPETDDIFIHTNIESASFTISGTVPFSGSGILCRERDAPAGTYTITYQDVSGYNTPISETKTLSAGGSITFTGKYEPVWPLSMKLLVIGVILSLIGIVLRLFKGI